MPLALRHSRDALRQLLDDPGIEDTIFYTWSKVKDVVWNWFFRYKEWERNDTFDAAFADARMTIRYGKREVDALLDMQATPVVGGERASEQKAWPGFHVGVGMLYVWRRTMPSNFRLNLENKKEEGLYDLSASLLDPRKNISEQTFKNAKSGGGLQGHRFVFMPLSHPEDQAIFSRLSQLLKRLVQGNVNEGVRGFRAAVRYFRARMTRIKLARESDIGTNFGAYAPWSAYNPKFKYGPGKSLKIPGGLSRKVTPEDWQAFRDNAMNFRRILTGGSAVNEIVIAYREHAGHFPVFAEFDNGRFEIWEFTPGQGLGGYHRARGHISDDGRLHP